MTTTPTTATTTTTTNPTTAGRPRRVTIAAKLGVVMGAMTLVAAVVAGVLFAQLRQVTTTYDELLNTQVRSALQAREMQVSLKKQVQEWKDVLLRGFAPKDLATYTKQFHEQSDKVDDLGRSLLTVVADDDVRAQVQTFLDEHAALNRNYAAAYSAFVAAGAQDPRVPDKAVRGQDRPPTDLIDGIVDRLQTAVADRTAQQAAAVADQQRVLALVGGVALLAMLATLAFVVAGIVRPIRALTQTAYLAARRTLPEAIEQIGNAGPDAQRPQLPAIDVRSHDELGDLAAALTSMQESSVDLAVLQHKAEREAADMLVNLGRRNQSLLKRTLGYVSELEAQETDPDVLAKLFRLDHATTRIRRNAESMLVLAGAEQTRTWSRPVQVADVVRAALSEIEDYTRVDLHHVEPVALVGNAAADVIHLVAELAENAAAFSPPSSRVTVVGQVLADTYRLRIIDEGVGMTRSELDAANARIARAADGRADSPLLGFYVVGRLAARRGIAVELEPSAGRGITATVLIPQALFSDGAEAPRTEPGGFAPVPSGSPGSPVGREGQTAARHAAESRASAPTVAESRRRSGNGNPGAAAVDRRTPVASAADRGAVPAVADPPVIAVRAIPDPTTTDPRGLAAIGRDEPTPAASAAEPREAADDRNGQTPPTAQAEADSRVPEPRRRAADQNGHAAAATPAEDDPQVPEQRRRTVNRNGHTPAAAQTEGDRRVATDPHGLAPVPDQRPPSDEAAQDASPSGWFDPGLVDDEPPTPTVPVVPRRVRGAQLPDLAIAGDPETAFATPDPDEVRRQLGALAAGQVRAQRDRRRDTGSHRHLNGHPRPAAREE